MGHPQIVEGTGTEIAALLQSEPFAHVQLRVTIDLDEIDLLDNLPAPPLTIRDRDHLIELLLEGVNSPKHEVTEETWQRRYDRIRSRQEKGNNEPEGH